MTLMVYELNEVPKKLFNFYADTFPKSAFATLRNNSRLFETETADVGALSPWITWPTMHRGVSNIEHEISDLGQDLSKVNAEFPNIFNVLAENNVKVGVFGSLQSYPLPDNLDGFDFYVPDTFAAGSECYPEQLSDFQSFNLSMVRANGRNVSKGVAIKDAGRFVANAGRLGLTFKTFNNLAKQVVTEQVKKDRVVRRRSSQAEIAFDIFYKQLVDTKPDIAFFFTNHVASAMHRYWPTIFPGDYPEGKFEKDWCMRWQGEIPHAVKVANYQLEQLITLSKKTRSELLVCSSMGQGAVEDVTPISKQVLITRVKSLLSYLGIGEDEWEPRLSMAPRVVIKPKTSSLIKKLERLENIKVNEKKVNFHVTSTNDVRFDLDLTNVDTLSVSENGEDISASEIGIEIVDLQDASGSYAYHIPQGILLHYQPEKPLNAKAGTNWDKVSVLDFAPSLIKKFEGRVPGYMQGENILFAG